MSAGGHREQQAHQSQRTTRSASREHSGKRDQLERHSDIEDVSAVSHKTSHGSTSHSHDEQYGTKRERRKTYKKRNPNTTLPSPPIETPITSVLGDLREDIEETNFSPQHTGLILGDGGVGDSTLLRGRPHGPVYVESRRGFSQITRERAFDNEDRPTIPFWGYRNQSYNSPVIEDKPVHLAINVQAFWMPFATFCHGILAGLCLMQTIFVEIMAQYSEKGLLQFAAVYGKISQFFSSLVYVLITLCLIAVFDRMDISHADCRSLLDLLSGGPRLSWLLVPLYIVGVVMTFLAARTDDWLATRYDMNITFIGNATVSTAEKTDLQMFEAWRIYNIIRCVCVVTGWLVLATARPKDLLLAHLKTMIRPPPPAVS